MGEGSGRKHEVVREDLENALRARCPATVGVVGEPQLNLTDDTYTEPDLLVRPIAIRTPDVRGDTVLLVVEIAASSKGYDLATKAALYAQFGVRVYWVVVAATLETTMHRDPSAIGAIAEITGRADYRRRYSKIRNRRCHHGDRDN